MTAEKKAIKFKRMADALFEEPQLSSGSGSSSGSDHFPSGSLSDLVNSFIQKVDDDDDNPDTDGDGDGDGDLGLQQFPNSSGGHQRKELLIKLLASDDDDNTVGFRRKLIQEIEACFGDVISINPKNSGFKRQLMVHLRDRGYDAGLCKSRWEKTGRYPAGSYEYVDVISEGRRRYIVEVNPAAELEIARPTEQYRELMEELPRIFIGEAEKLKKMVRLMSTAIKESLKRRDLEVAPWRRNAYLQAQWFAPYKRTTNCNAASSSLAVTSTSPNVNTSKIRRTVVGFPHDQGLVFINCRHAFSTKGANRIGLLAASLQANS